MKIFIIRGAYGDVYEPSWRRSLIKLGHEVFLFDCHEYTLPSFFGKMERSLLIGPSITRIRKKSIELAGKWNPDIILLYQGHYHDLKSIKALSEIAWTTGYHNDNPFAALEDGRHMFRYKYLIPSLSGYNSYHVYRDSNVEQFRNLGIKYVSKLMSYYIPELDYPSYSNLSDLGGDVIFAGHPEKDGRELYINSLLRENIDIKIYGHSRYWKPLLDDRFLSKMNHIRVLNTYDYRLALSNSKICLSFFSKWNRDLYTRRVFEIPAMKKFLLAERTDVMQSLYVEGEEAEFFSTVDELIDKTRFYLKNEALREKIATAGYLRCINSGYDIDSRMNQWLIDINEWKKRN